MHFFFCISHAHAFFMHTYPFFSIFLVLCCEGAFLFVSLSLSLSDSLCMAPKCKSTLSRNPLRSGTSSFDPTPLHIRFRDEMACKGFSKNFSNCGIHLERHMVLSNFSDTALPTVIYSRGWESLCEIPMRCPTVIIQEFYSNMHSFNTSIQDTKTK